MSVRSGMHVAAATRAAARGFTLIELMIAVVVVSILAAVAYPTYHAQLRKARRSDAQAYALDVVARQQQFLLDRRTFATSVSASVADNGLGLQVPASVSSFYRLDMATVTDAPPRFTLTLTPIGVQAADVCGLLTVNQAGVRTAGAGSKCW